MSRPEGYIYLIQDIPNRKIYIGCRALPDHVKSPEGDETYYGSCYILNMERTRRPYDQFKKRILERVEKIHSTDGKKDYKKLLAREQHWFKMLRKRDSKTYYNNLDNEIINDGPGSTITVIETPDGKKICPEKFGVSMKQMLTEYLSLHYPDLDEIEIEKKRAGLNRSFSDIARTGTPKTENHDLFGFKVHKLVIPRQDEVFDKFALSEDEFDDMVKTHENKYG